MVLYLMVGSDGLGGKRVVVLVLVGGMFFRWRDRRDFRWVWCLCGMRA